MQQLSTSFQSCHLPVAGAVTRGFSSSGVEEGGGDLSSPLSAMGFVEGWVSGPVVGTASADLGTVTDITRSGDGVGVAVDALPGVVPVAPLVPGQRQEPTDAAAPVPVEKAGRGGQAAPHPLVLSPVMRSRLRAAVRALINAPGLVDRPDAVRLAAVVLAAKTSAANGEVVIRKRELGRWIGASEGHMKAVVRSMRASTVVRTRTHEKEGSKKSEAMDCLVLPLWLAMRDAQGPAGRSAMTGEREALALERRELAVLLRLVEHLFAPGWSTAGGGLRDAGMLAGRTGRGAATDRLALLLLVLEAGDSGRVPLCGGVVDTHVGRPAATLARMLRRSPKAAATVLGSLKASGVVELPRRRTLSGLKAKEYLVVPAVAAAHQDAEAGLGLGAGTGDVSREEASGTPDPAAGGSDVATPPEVAPVTEETSQVSEVPEAEIPEIAEPPVATPLHAYHSPVAGPCEEVIVDGGSSGACAVVVEDRRPQRTDVREEHTGTAEDGQGPIPVGASVGEGGPLRGEKPKISSTRNVQEQSGLAAGGQRPVLLPPQDLLLALAPVESLWERLDRRWAREKIIDVARLELALLARWTGRQGADQALAERLKHRLRVQGGSALVTDPVGWLLRKGLPRRQECSNGACDDGIRLDTGAECATCEMCITDRRSTRRAVVGQVVAQMPDAAPGELRSAIDEQLHRHAELRAGQQVAERQRTERRRVEAEARHAVREAEAAAAEAARRVLACEDCGAERAGGLCALCRTYRTTRTVMVEAVNLALAGTANLADRAEVGAVIRQVNAALREEMLQSRPAGADLCGIRESDLITVRSAAAEYRASTLELLARSPQADLEAEQAHAAAMRRAHRHPNRASALEAADRAADQARHNTAGCLLVQRLGAVQAMRERSRQTPTAPVGMSAREAVTA